MLVDNKIREAIQVVLNERLENISLEKIEVNLNPDPKFGDYMSNVALKFAKELQTNPKKLAEDLALELSNHKPLQDYIYRVEPVANGFINFWLCEKYLNSELSKAIEQGVTYGNNTNLKGQKVIIEYTDPNPFKEFHIGHLMSNSIGEALSRLVERSGAEVKRANYQGDVGMHVAKSIWGVQRVLKEEGKPLDDYENKSLGEKAAFLGRAYTIGAQSFVDDDRVKSEIAQLNKVIYEKSNSEINNIYETGRKWSLDYFETIYDRLGTKFDYYFFESEVGQAGVDIVKKYLQEGVFEESEGAVVFPGEKYGLHTRVFINQLGLPTYEAKELALSELKHRQFPYDRSIVVTGNEIDEYFKVLLKAMELVYPDLAKKTRHVSHGMLRLKTGKMSSRTGEIITGTGLMKDMADRTRQKMKNGSQSEGINHEVVDVEITAEIVSIGAIKYSILRQGLGRDIVFDFEQSLSLEGNSGPYLQYTYARAKSVLRKAGVDGLDSLPVVSNPTFDTAELLILRALAQFPMVIEQATSNMTPNHMANYLFDLAQKFNNFYQTHPIIGDPNEKVRLVITAGVAIVIQNGLDSLGIRTVEKM
jgi:arginyl-tRNA synthetase